MSNGNLDTLTDAELSELFAVEVAGFAGVRSGTPWEVNDEPPAVRRVGRVKLHDTSKEAVVMEVPDYATSADAVLPWLENNYGEYEYAGAAHFTGATGPAEWHIRVFVGNGTYVAKAPTFPRAACIALIRAKRATP